MLNRRYEGRPADRSVFAEVAREAENHPGRVALIARSGGKETLISYAQLVDHAWRDAVKLAALGIAAGAKVAILCENQPDWLRSYLALSAADAQTIAIGEDAEEDLRAALVTGRPVAVVGSTAALGALSPEIRAALGAAGVKLIDYDRELSVV